MAAMIGATSADNKKLLGIMSGSFSFAYVRLNSNVDVASSGRVQAVS